MNVRLNYILAQQDGVLVVPFDAVFTTARGGTAVLGVAKDARGRAVLQEFPVVTAAGDVVTIAG